MNTAKVHLAMNSNDILRYSKNIKLNQFGAESQNKLLNSKVLVIGLGGLGLSCALNLCANGIGTIGLVDSDIVDISNLHRQIFYNTDQIGQHKVDGAYDVLHKLNPTVNIIKYNSKITRTNAEDLFSNFDVIVDCTDNLEAHLIINDGCYFFNKKLVCAGVNEYTGLAFSVVPGISHCFRCLYNETEYKGGFCSNDSVYGPLVVMLGSLQASEVVKFAINNDNILLDRIAVFDLISNEFSTFRFGRNPKCPLCGLHPTIEVY